MELKKWPAEFFSKKRGDGCPQCATGRVDETEHGVRYYAGAHADAYLQRQAPSLGYSVVIFRRRHVAEPQSMTPQEHAAFWTDIGVAAKAIEAVFAPIHLNYQLLGNRDPHVHVHVIPRYDPDPAPSLPLPPEVWASPTDLTPHEMATHVAALRAHAPPAA